MTKEYNPGREIGNIILNYNKCMNKHNAEVKKIKEMYAPKVAHEKAMELESSVRAEKENFKSSLDAIMDKASKYQEEVKSKALENEDYKIKRKEALDILLKVGDKLDKSVISELIAPMIEAKDITTLKICKATSNKDTSMIYDRAIGEAENESSISYLERAIRDAKSYIQNPGNLLPYQLSSYIYHTDIDMYNKLRD